MVKVGVEEETEEEEGKEEAPVLVSNSRIRLDTRVSVSETHLT